MEMTFARVFHHLPVLGFQLGTNDYGKNKLSSLIHSTQI